MRGDARRARTPAPAPAPIGAGRFALVVLATLAAAILLGVVGRAAAGAGLIAHAGPVAEPVTKLGPWVIALGAPWLAVAWLLGALSGRVVLGAVAGALALVGGTGAWYAFTVWQVGRAALDYTVPVAMAWGVAALAAGAVFGAAGAIWRSGGTDFTRALGVAILAGCLIGEAILLLTQWSGRAARTVLAGELLVGLALPVVLLARRPRALVLAIVFTAALAMLAAGGESYVRDALRGVGWGGR